MAFLRVLCLSPLSLSLSLCVAYVCKNCHTMTLIRGFGTPLTPLLSRPRDLMDAIYLFIIIAAFYYTDLFL